MFKTPLNRPSNRRHGRSKYSPETTQAKAVNERSTPRREYVAANGMGTLRRKFPKTPKGKAAIKAAKRLRHRQAAHGE
jgi:hypothetical protein